jgi:sugar transferase (PEP-CTERM/EpsH1 system associated)
VNARGRRPRILFLTHRLPYAPNRGDRIRAYHTLRTLRPIADVDVVSLVHDSQEASQVGAVQDIATSVRVARVPHWTNRVRALPRLLTSAPLTHVLLHSPDVARHIATVVRERKPDLVYAYCSGIADHVFQPAVVDIPLIVDMVDVDSAKWASLADARPWWHPLRAIYTRESRVLAKFEVRLTRHAETSAVINERERALLSRLAPGASVRAIGNGVDCERLRPTGPPSADPNVVFCGVMNYEPNEQGMLWFIEQVWPLVLAARPDARLKVVGASPTPRLVAAGSAAQGVTVTGSVPQVEPFLWEAAVSVAPLVVARGMQNKVIEAIAAGLPVVVTPQVAEGLPPEAMPACVEAVRPDAFAREVVQFLGLAPEERRARAQQADLASLAWPRRLQPIIDIVRSVIDTR